MKVIAGVGVELRQIYLSGRRSHHPNDAPCQKLSNPNYHPKRGTPPSCRRSGKRKERGPALPPVASGGGGGGARAGKARRLVSRQGALTSETIRRVESH